MEYIIIQPNSNEWNYMWDWLAKHPINENIDVPSVANYEGEVWQYMGSFKQDNKVIHSFRHRSHPLHGQRVDLHVQASESFNPDEILTSNIK